MSSLPVHARKLRPLKLVVSVESWSIEARECFSLAAVLIALRVGSYLIGTFTNEFLRYLGPNLVAGFIGSAVTIFGFDVILRRRQQRLHLPIQGAIQFDMCLVCFSALSAAFKAIQSTDVATLDNPN